MRLVLLIIIFIQVAHVTAQLQKPDCISFSPKGGFLIAHRPNMSHLLKSNSSGYEFTAWYQVKDSSIHTQRHKNPLYGVSAEIRSFGYKEVLGNAYSITGYMVFPLLQWKQNNFFDLTVGTGIGYLTEKYDKVDNPLNNAIGSHLNGRVNIKLSYLHQFKKTHVGLGIEFMHFSNGSIKTPNLGLNLPSIYVQFGYNFCQRINKNSLEKTPINKQKSNSPHAVNAELILTAKEIGAIPFQPKLYPVIASRFSYTFLPNDFWGFELATDIIHNESNYHKYNDTTFTRNDILQIGLYAGAFIKFYQSELAFGLGYYLRDKINPEASFYNRVGYRFFTQKNIFFLFNIKAHYAKADYFEFGVGYRFKTRCKKS